MILEETIQKLLDLKLGTMAQALRETVEQSPGNQLSFEEKIGLIVDREWTERQNRRLARRRRDAKLRAPACLEDVSCDPGRGIDKATVRSLGTGKWIRAHHNVIAVGATGTGKTFIGAALADAACRQGFRALCFRVPRLLHDLAISRADGSYAQLLSKLAKVHVLVLDDFLIAPMSETERRDLLEILEDRYDNSSTVITSQLPTKMWHAALSDPTLADAICDRVVHNSHVLSLKGPSKRKQKGMGG